MTERVGLIGWPVEHSRSPAMHNAAFKALGLNWRYQLLKAAPGTFQTTVKKALADGFCGFNITVPYKDGVLGLDELDHYDPWDAVTKELGAANTLTRLQTGTLRATNTDWIGFLDDLIEHGVDVTNRVCLIMGTGGSAKAVAYALLQLNAQQILFASRYAKFPQIRKGQIAYDEIGQLDPLPTLIVNCSPLGMEPHRNQSAWPEDLPFPKDAIVYDLVYNPPVTRLMARAQEAGLQTIGGIGMLVRQGAASFEQWTGIKPPIDVMMRAAEIRVGEPS